MRKITGIGFALLAVATALSIAAPEATAAVRSPIHRIRHRPGPGPAWNGYGVACDQNSLCIDMGSGGVGDPVKAFAYTGHSSQTLQFTTQTGMCNAGFVTDVGTPCPFKAGSGLNTIYKGGRIVEIGNPNVSGDYAADGNEEVKDVTSGNGQIWVQVGQIDNSSDYGMLANLYWTNQDQGGDVHFLTDDGSGGQLNVIPSPNGPAASLNWTEYFHIPGT